MKKRSLLMLVVTLVLVATVGVGATLAYLSDSTGTVTNTFSVGNVGGSTLENVPGNNADEDGYEYTLQPGDSEVKAPYVAVEEGSVKAYVYLKVTNIAANATNKLDVYYNGVKGLNVGTDATQWTEIQTVDATSTTEGYSVYRYNTVVDASQATKAVETAVLFDTIKFDSTATTGENLKDMVASGFLHQAEINNLASDTTPMSVADAAAKEQFAPAK